MLLAQGDTYPLLDLFWTMLVFFGFVVWFWLLFVIFGDVFRRHDIGGWGKAGWTVLIIVLPIVGSLIYLIAQGHEMSDRRAADVAAARADYERDVRNIAGNGHAAGPTDQIAAGKRLLDEGAITPEEFDALKRKALGSTAAHAAP
ncbi:SHOCT domain-containing protein [Actinomycetospora sp. TBRC 11914]|uniref:SHOCT domain-containing protein n=1 Tax=Actinomycetospora sp. TBRC 11914 TaxID=2729387 RepID=UPI00145F66A7|nr:SHOCT domain-containing protein [Actinomycetospora sp. TBRC 11914]NMO88296.1 SHOCT domain-containing protein [Actinomycetospora sp. TBRC 11914]